MCAIHGIPFRKLVTAGVIYKSIGKNYKVNAEISAGSITKWSAIVEMIGLTFTFYLFYLGLSAFQMKYINRKGRFIYK